MMRFVAFFSLAVYTSLILNALLENIFQTFFSILLDIFIDQTILTHRRHFLETRVKDHDST